MEPQTMINLAFGALGGLGGFMLNRLWTSVDRLQSQDSILADKVQGIELLVAGQYVRRDEFDRFTDRLFVKLDEMRIFIDQGHEKLAAEIKGKVDK